MAVIINEFEVVVEEQEAQPGGETEAAAGAVNPIQKLSPQDLHDVTRHEYARLTRIWAD